MTDRTSNPGMAAMNSSAGSNIPVLSRTGAYLKAISMRTFLRLTIFGMLFALVALALGTPGPAQAVERTLVSNTGQPTYGLLSKQNRDFAQQFKTGLNSTRYLLDKIGVSFEQGPSGNGITKVTVRDRNSNGDPSDTVKFELTNPVSLGSGLQTFTAPVNAVLEADTRYFVVISVNGNLEEQPSYNLVVTDQEDDTSASNWRIANDRKFRNIGSTGGWSSHHFELKIKVEGEVNPPAALTNLTAVAGDGQVTLSWVDPDNPGINGYEFSTDSEAYTNITSGLDTSDENTISYTDTGLTNGQMYTFSVRAVNEADPEDSPASTVTATPMAVPAAPAGLTATAGDGEVTLSWTDPGNDTITRHEYRYQEGTNVDGDYTDIPDSGADQGNESGYSFTGLDNGVTYTFGVRAVNAAHEGPESTVSVVMVPAVLTGLVATAGGSEVTLSWTDPVNGTINGYGVSSDGGATYTTVTLASGILDASAPGTIAYTVANLNNGQTYNFAVRAVNGSGFGPESTATATPLIPPAVPANFTAVQTGVGEVTLEWDEPSSDQLVSGYQYTLDDPNDDPTWSAVSVVSEVLGSNPARLSGIITGLAAGNNAFAVRAVNNAGPSDASDSVSVTVEAQALAPSNFSVDTGEGVVRLEWDASTDSTITRYEYVQLREVIKLTPDSGTDPTKEFGVSVAMDGDILVVGASRENFTDTNDPSININNAGAAYIYTRVANEWTRAGKLTASLPVDGARFGESVAVDGDTVVVGALQDDLFNDDDTLRIDKSGAAYVFTKPQDGWADMTETAKLIAGDAAEDDDFGNSVAIDGETIVVGAPQTRLVGAPQTGRGVGSVYVFVEPGTGWADGTQTAKLATGDEKDKAGTSVAVYEDTIVVGAPHDVSARGEALVFIKPLGGWDNTTSRQARLRHSGSAINEFFGNSVAIDGDTIIVGAYGDGDPHQAGSAFVFVKPETGWADKTSNIRLRAPSRAMEDRFGRSVAIDGDTVVVGSRQDDGNGDDSGSAFVYTKPATGWANTSTPTTHRTAYDREAGDNFGQSVAVDNGVVVVGAWKHASNAGAAYVFTNITESDWKFIGGSGQTTTSHLLTGLPNDVAYTFRVRAVNAAGAGFSSVPIVATPALSEPEPPTDLFVMQTGVGTVSLTWGVSPSDLLVTGYQYTQNYVQNGEVVWADVPSSTSTTTSHTVAGLAAGESYTFAVRAVNRDFQSDASMQDFTVASRPAAPGNFKVDADYERVTLTWEAPSDDSGVTGYELMQLVEQIELTASDGKELDRFGVSVAVEGNTAVVGAFTHNLPLPGDPNNNISDAGAAYVFTRVGGVWGEVAKLTASDASAEANFGVSVATQGDTIVVGARGAATSTGAVYVFSKPAGGWADMTETEKLTASDGKEGDWFGGSVAIAGATIVIGATGAKNTVSDAEVPTGSTYVFTRTNSGSWGQKAKLTAPNAAEDDEFGISVDIDGDVIAVGASRHDGSDDLTDSGAAYVYSMQAGVWATTTASVRLAPSDPVDGGRFGNSVSVDGETIVVGASGDRDSADADPTGAAYVFIRPAGGWVDGNEINQTAKLTASDGGRGDQFGRSARVDGDTIVVGAHGNNKQGSIYLFTKPTDGWVDTTDAVKLAAFDGMEDDRFGIQVALDGDTALVTAPRRDSNGKEQSGSTYVIDISKWADITGSNSTTDTHTVTQLAADVPYTFAVRAVDIWGAGAPSSDGPVLAIANSPPSFTDGGSVTLTVEENTAEGDDVGSPVSATDPDGDDTLTYTLSGTDASSFEIDDSGQISVAAGSALDYESGTTTYSFVVSVTDGKGPDGNATTTIDATIMVTIDVTNVDEPGEVSLSSLLPIVNATTTAKLTDPDGGVSDITWQWSTSTDQVNWNDIAGATSTDYIPSADDVGYYLRATASYNDGHGDGKSAHAVAEWPVAVEGTVFGTPFFASATTTRAVDENAASGTNVGAAVTATDRNYDELEYTLTGTDEASFSIDASSGQISVGDETTLDYETKQSYSLVVTADDGQASASIQVTINVNNLEESGEAFLSSELPIVNSTTTASLKDPDEFVPEEVSWQWATSTDQVNWNDIAGATSTDYIPSADDVGYYLRATASYIDGFGSGIETERAVAEWPVAVEGTVFGTPFFASATTTRAVDENAASGTPVGAAVTATDRNYDDLTYTLSGTGASLFEIGADGQITVGTPLNYESATTTSFVVSVTDRKDEDGNADDSIDATIEVEIVVINVNEPGVVTLSPPRPQENSTSTASLMDPDVVEPAISWQWARLDPVDGSDWADISGATSTSYLPAASDVGLYLSITATYNDGFATTTVGASYRSAVLDRDVDVSAPYFDLDIPVEFEIPENASRGFVVGSVTANDDNNDTLTYTLSGTDAAPFAIDDQGQISLGTALDFELPADADTGNDYVVTVRASDATTEVTLDITITVVNVEEAGTVTLSPDQPMVNTELIASLSDPDGVEEDAISWQWTRSADGSDPWTVIGSNSSSYTPTAADGGNYLRAWATYTDGEGPSKSAFAVTASAVAAINSAPYFGADVPKSFEIPENASPGDVVGRVTATDDDGDELTYSLSGAHADSFTINDSTGQISVAAGVTFDLDLGPTVHYVTVEVHDGKNPYGILDTMIDASVNVVITVTEVVDEAGAVSLSASQPQVGTRITATLTDPDDSLSGISWQWSRSPNRSGPWTNIGSNSGSYTPSANDVGDYLRAEASYTDGHGTGKSASVTSANRVQAADSSVSQPGRPQPTPTPAPTPTPVPITVVPDEDIVPVPTVGVAAQSVHLIDPTKSSEVTSSDGAVNLRFPRESRDRTYQVKVDRSPAGCAGGVDPLAGMQVACFSVDIYTAEGDLETNVRLIRPASGEIRMTPDQVDDLGGLTVLYQAYVLGGVSVLKRDGAADTWSPVRFELEITGDGGARIRIPSIRTFSSFALTIDETILAQAGGQVAALATAMPSPTAAARSTATPTGVDLSPTPLPGVDVGDATAPPGLLLALLAAGLVLTIAGTRAVRGRRTNSRR